MTGIQITDFVVVLFIFLRIVAALSAAPVFGNKAMPVLSRMILSFFLAVIIFLAVDTSSWEIEFTISFLAITAIKEIITGLIIGFMVNLVFYGISFAGTFIGFDIGLMMAQVMNPLEETNNNVVGEMIYFSAMLIFFLVNGHHYVLKGLGYSFTIIPIGSETINESVNIIIIKYSAQVFILAVKIASPIIVSFFLVKLAEGVTARVIPQMQVFFVTQPLKIGLGFILLSIGVPIYVHVIKNLLESYENSLFELIKAME
ncbi:MAG: flagellar biosynthetic protein FliR [Ignavibacteriae bacterium]|jgi:flagellar biosynthetic protein FliR|nr:flagellar biosynthetic protein FliR [Ignavibacteriota bacterium]NOG97151.1 flagellar biosynthetic protein FliR [Ignavibacteriota bacterium]